MLMITNRFCLQLLYQSSISWVFNNLSYSSIFVCKPKHVAISNKTPNWMQQSIIKFYCFVVRTLLNMFRALLCPSSGARQTALAASGFRMNVEVDVFSKKKIIKCGRCLKYISCAPLVSVLLFVHKCTARLAT